MYPVQQTDFLPISEYINNWNNMHALNFITAGLLIEISHFIIEIMYVAGLYKDPLKKPSLIYFDCHNWLKRYSPTKS